MSDHGIVCQPLVFNIPKGINMNNSNKVKTAEQITIYKATLSFFVGMNLININPKAGTITKLAQKLYHLLMVWRHSSKAQDTYKKAYRRT